MQHDWFMYHLRSTYKNRLDFPFNKDILQELKSDQKSSGHSRLWSIYTDVINSLELDNISSLFFMIPYLHVLYLKSSN